MPGNILGSSVTVSFWIRAVAWWKWLCSRSFPSLSSNICLLYKNVILSSSCFWKSLLQSTVCKLKASSITLLNNFISPHLVVVLSVITNCRFQFPLFHSGRNISSGYSIFRSAVVMFTFVPSPLCCSNQNKDWRVWDSRMLLPCHMQTNNQDMVRSLFCIIFGLQEHMPFAREEFC
jgi:hypothetical protein